MSEFKISKEDFEKLLQRDDLVDTLGSKSKEEIEEMFGKTVARMVNYDQNNPHHCYDLWNHTLNTVAGINPEGLTKQGLIKLKVAAFFHDIAKPDVMTQDPRTGNSRFFGHAGKSADIADPILSELGYSQEERDQLEFLIAHHDDFISYKTTLKPFERNHVFVRTITPETIAEKMVENHYDFQKLGVDDPKIIRAICYEFIHDQPLKAFDKKKKALQKVSFDKDLVVLKARSGRCNRSYQPSMNDYKLLLKLCEADANAQSEEVRDNNGEVISSKEQKMENMKRISENVAKAYETFSKKHLKSSAEQMMDIIRFLGFIRINRMETMSDRSSEAYRTNPDRVKTFESNVKQDLEEFGAKNPDFNLILAGIKSKAMEHKNKVPANSIFDEMDEDLIDDINFVEAYTEKRNPLESEIKLPISDDEYVAFNLLIALKGSLISGKDYDVENLVRAMKQSSTKTLELMEKYATESNVGTKDAAELLFVMAALKHNRLTSGKTKDNASSVKTTEQPDDDAR